MLATVTEDAGVISRFSRKNNDFLRKRRHSSFGGGRNRNRPAGTRRGRSDGTSGANAYRRILRRGATIAAARFSAGALPASVSTEPGSAGRRKRAAVAAHDMNLWIVEVSRCQMTGLGILIELEIDLENSGFGLSSQRSL